jgi:flagellar basal body-associated protein FliL
MIHQLTLQLNRGIKNMKSKSESGIAHIAILILVLLVIAAVAVVGLRVVQNQNTGEDTSSAPVASKNSDNINSVADLDAAKASLTNANVDSDLNPDSLNADLDSVL